MCSSAGISTCEMEPLCCIQDLTNHEELLKRFINDLENREKNFTQNLKKINDTLEALISAKNADIPEFLLRDPSKIISGKKKKKKKRSRSRKQCLDDSTTECIEISDAMSLKDLAKKYEKVLKKAKEQGLSRLVKPLKESAMRLRELSQAGCTCEFEANLDVNEQEHEIDQSTDPKKMDRSNADKETVRQENDSEVPCKCSEGKWVSDNCEEMCNSPVDNRTRVPNTRKTLKRHKSKNKKNTNAHVKSRNDKKRTEKSLKIEDLDICDFSEDSSIDKLRFDINATQNDESMISEPCAYNTQDNRIASRSCKDLAIDHCEVDPECLKNDFNILKSLIQNLTTIDKSVIAEDNNINDGNFQRSIRDESMIQDQKMVIKSALKGMGTQTFNKEPVQKNPEITSSCMLDPSVIYESLVDKNLTRKIAYERCPLDGDTNVKDEACQCVDDAKESGRTNRSKRRRKDHKVKHRGKVNQEFNVKRCQTSNSAHSAIFRTDRNSSYSPATEIIIVKGTYPVDNQCDSEERSICSCGCDIVEESMDQVCPCGCAEVGVLHDNDTCKYEDNMDLFCEPTQNTVRSKKKDFEKFKHEVHTIITENDSLKKCCPCGCAEIVEIEDNTMVKVEDDAPSKNNDMQNISEESEEDIEVLATKLEEEIYSVKGKNDELKELMKSCYCDENVDEILALQCSQLPPIRATHSGLTTTIKMLQSKCHTKDRMITVLAKELQGSKNVDQIAKNLTAPCLQFTYWDFDQCGLYSYLQNPKLLSNAAKEEICQLYQTPKPSNFRVVREICNCLLVSWNIPENIRGLRGYEIVVNGNVVAARVRNPMRTEAVLGPFHLSGSTVFPGSIILTLYAVDSHGQYSEPSSIKFSCCNRL